MTRVYSVGEVNRYIRGLITDSNLLASLSVRGEVSNCKYHSSGHIYFSIKDEQAAISCVMFAGSRGGLAFRMKDGDKVVVMGRVDVYERDGRYQLYALRITREGEGLLYERYLELKRKLAAEGLFDPAAKKAVPRYAATVGIVTAPTGAAIRDIQNIARRRNPFVQLILCPAQVQGQGAAESVAAGIRALDGFADVLIVGRGGGSIEDLWAFNEEVVARAIAACETPVISAVGHETDTTIADFAADLRAPTPSAAAELAVFDLSAVRSDLSDADLRMRKALRTKLRYDRVRLGSFREKLKARSPKNVLFGMQQKSAAYDVAFENLMARKLKDAAGQAQLTADRYRAFPQVITERALLRERDLQGRIREYTDARLEESRRMRELYIVRYEGLNPLTRLRQGYAFIAEEDGKAVSSVSQLDVGMKLHIRLKDGGVRAKILETFKEGEIRYE